MGYVKFHLMFLFCLLFSNFFFVFDLFESFYVYLFICENLNRIGNRREGNYMDIRPQERKPEEEDQRHL